MSIEQIVDVQISRETATVTAAGFGRAMILSQHTKTANQIDIYSSLTAVADDFDTTDPEYKAAAKLFGQAIKPTDIAIGKRAAPVAQVDDIEIGALAAEAYGVTLNGTLFSYETLQVDSITGASDGTPQTVDVIINTTTIPWTIPSSPNMGLAYEDLLGLINASSEPVTASYINVGDHSQGIYITEDAGGGAFTLSLSGETGTLAAANVTAHGAAPADTSTVAAGLMALINAGTEPVTASLTGSSPNEDLKLTADNAGEPFTVAVTSNMTNVATTPNHGVQEDLAAIVASGDTGNDWYALMMTSRYDYDILQGAIWVEANRKLFIACSSAAGIIAATTTDIAAALSDAAYDRTALLYSSDEANYPDAAWLGKMLPKDPGSATWNLKTLAGITKDELTDTQITNLKNKNANYYIEIGGVNITQNGNVASAEWIDVIRGIDWIEARAQENIYALLVAVDKIPFTNAGIDQVTNKLEEILVQAVTRGILTEYDITRPLASSFTTVQKQSRELTGIEFTGTLAGAVHKVTIVGKVSV